MWGRSLGNPNIQYILNVHIPFCAHKCDFCTHAVEGLKNPNMIDKYLNFLESEAKRMQKIFESISFDVLYIS
jgi:coproporphyrinogen III oxidase-like Fe-S oxidoreductase